MVFLDIEQYISPSGMRMLFMVLLVLVLILVLIIRRWYLKYYLNPLRIKIKKRFSGGPKMSINIRNKSRAMVEIDAPVIEFREHRMTKRRFKIVPPGESGLFPLGMAPQTNYSFTVEFIRFYDSDPILRKYTKVAIWIKNRNGQTIRKKFVKIPKP